MPLGNAVGVMVGAATTVIVWADVVKDPLMLSVAVTVTLLKVPAKVGVPVMVAVVVFGVDVSVRPFGNPLALHVQQVAPLVPSVAVKVAPEYTTVTSPEGSEAGGVTVTCPFAAPAHTAIASIAHPQLIDVLVMAVSGAG